MEKNSHLIKFDLKHSINISVLYSAYVMLWLRQSILIAILPS